MTGRIEEEAQRRELFWNLFPHRDLTELALRMIIGPIYERTDIINDLASLLSTGECNPLLVGEPGAGKNAVVEGLACRLAAREVPGLNKRLFECTADSFVSGCLYAAEFETKIQVVVQNLRGKEAILFLDGTNQAARTGGTSDTDPRTLATVLSPYLARNELTLIGATTPEGYKAMQRTNSTFAGRFATVDISAMSPQQTRNILSGVKAKFEDRYAVTIEEASLDVIVDMAERFYRERAFPGKAFEILREVMAMKIGRHQRVDERLITPDDVYVSVRQKTGLPDFVIFPDTRKDRQDVKRYFTDRLFGQEEAVDAVVDTVLSLKAEVNDPRKPVGVFMFVGPTGVGKTYLARTLATYLFGSEDRLLRYDMPEYSTYDSMEKLIGHTRKGGDHGKLVDDVTGYPFSVILLDEIEKAHDSIFDLLLPVMGEGRLTDASGRTVSFCNSIIIMTSNLGAQLYGKIPMGFATESVEKELRAIDRDIIKKVNNWFRPEFINRLTKIVSFKPLSREVIRTIAERELEALAQRRGIASRKIKIHPSDRLLERLMCDGYDHQYGARPMQRAVQKYLGYPLATAISAGDVAKGAHVCIDLDEAGGVAIRKRNAAKRTANKESE